MKEVVDYLTKLDFSKVEIKLYLTLLKNGPMSVSVLSKKAKVNRTAIYSQIDSLFQKGVLIKTTGKRNEIAATSPESLKYLVENKAYTVRNLESKLPFIVDKLNFSTIDLKTENNSEIKHYYGKNAVKEVYKEILKSNEIRAYFDATELNNVLPENFSLFDDTIASNPNIKVYEIAQDSLRAREQMNDHGERHYWKFLPSHIKLTSNDILIYDGKVAIINLRSEADINGVVLNNRDYYNNSVQLFDLLWEFLPDPKL